MSKMTSLCKWDRKDLAKKSGKLADILSWFKNDSRFDYASAGTRRNPALSNAKKYFHPKQIFFIF
jgi:hypothetical protein